jgi:hypothetical protein
MNNEVRKLDSQLFSLQISRKHKLEQTHTSKFLLIINNINN